MTEENNEAPQPTWFIDDGIPGVGDRPSWLNEKFKTVADLGKSYNELEKKVGIAPESYDFSKSKYLDPDYVPFQELQKVAKDKRVPQEFMDKMIESVDKYMDEFSTDYNEEIKKLGDNAKDRLNILDNWAQANLSKGSYEALTANIRDADSIKALEELRGKMMMNNPQVPNGNANANSTKQSVEDLKAELVDNMEKYKTDVNWRKNWQAKLEVAVKNEPGYIDKVGA